MPTPLRHCCRIASVVLFVALCGGRVSAEEIWVAPTHQQDVGGLGVGSNVVWPVTAIGAVRLALAIPNDLETFQSAKIVLLPNSPSGAADLVVYVCGAQPGSGATSNCSAATPHPFVGTASQLVEVDISAAVAGRVGVPGVAYLGILAYSTPTTNSDRIVGMRFAYDPVPPSGVATLDANTFSGTQTAPAFVGDGASLTNVNATLLDGLDSTAFATAAHTHDVSQVTNAARLNVGNLFTGTQTIDTGNLDLDPSMATTGNITKNGQLFLHNVGIENTFLGVNAGNLTMTGIQNSGFGLGALRGNTTGHYNTAAGYYGLFSNTTGTYNTASGVQGLWSNTTGQWNTASGAFALNFNTTGDFNTASGDQALLNNTTGSANVAVGHHAGENATTGSNNIYLGANVSGLSGEANAMYLGKVGTQTKTVIAGVRGTTVAGGEMVVIDANGRLGSGAVSPGLNTVGAGEVINESLTAADLGPDSVGVSEVAFNYAASTTEGGAATNADLLDGLNSTAFALAGSTATLGANTFAATQTIDAGNIDLDDSTPTAGNITKSGTRFLHNFGTHNTFVGMNAGNLTMSGGTNTASGSETLFSVTSGSGNTASGYYALHNITTGYNNVAVGFAAGNVVTTGSNNIYLGIINGFADESDTIHIGTGQTKTFVAGIRGITTGVANAIPVVIDSNGQLGTVSSSRRYKEDIHDMADASRRLLQLRPVTFRYTQAFAGGAKPVQYGLIAEEVAEVFPDLAVLNADGQPETVKYQDLSVLLLNELQRQQRELTTERARVEALEGQMTELLRRLSTLESIAK